MSADAICDNNPILSSILSSKTVTLPNGECRLLSAEITPIVGDILTSYIKQLKPRVSLEVGLAYGISALYICDALKSVGATRHIIIDPNQSQEWGNAGLFNLERSGHSDLIDFREEMSHVALPELLKAGLKIDFAFIDGWHVFDQVIVDFFFIDKMLKSGGAIAFDDAVWPSVRKALRYIVKNRNYRVAACSLIYPSRKDALARLASMITRRFPRVFAAEILEPDSIMELGNGSRCVILQKIGEDDRSITDHHMF